jgi:hypothetical protein
LRPFSTFGSLWLALIDNSLAIPSDLLDVRRALGCGERARSEHAVVWVCELRHGRQAGHGGESLHLRSER